MLLFSCFLFRLSSYSVCMGKWNLFTMMVNHELQYIGGLGSYDLECLFYSRHFRKLFVSCINIRSKLNKN